MGEEEALERCEEGRVKEGQEEGSGQRESGVTGPGEPWGEGRRLWREGDPRARGKKREG